MATPAAYIPVYKFHDLSDKAKGRARDWFRETNEFDHDCVIEDFSEICKRLGFSSADLQYSGFWTQGSGASFTGTWYAEDFDRNAIAEHAPHDEVLAAIADRLANEVGECPHATATLERVERGSYYHENTVRVADWENCLDETAKDLEEIFRCLMRWVYGQLREAYDADHNDEAANEFFDCNDGHTFFEDGSHA